MTPSKPEALKWAVAASLPMIGARVAIAAAKPDAMTLDYAYCNSVSLLLKQKGWLKEELTKDSIGVRWVLSLGSNKALEYLRGSSLDFGSTAGSATLIARAGGDAFSRKGMCW